jgi:hypothetical protein
LHDAVEGEIFDVRVERRFVDGCRMQTESLIVGNIAPAFALTLANLVLERPCYDRVGDVIIVVCTGC